MAQMSGGVVRKHNNIRLNITFATFVNSMQKIAKFSGPSRPPYSANYADYYGRGCTAKISENEFVLIAQQGSTQWAGTFEVYKYNVESSQWTKWQTIRQQKGVKAGNGVKACTYYPPGGYILVSTSCEQN